MWDNDRQCVVVFIKGMVFGATHLVMREDKDTVQTKCRKTAPKSDSYTGKYANIDCKVCRRI